MSHQGKSALQLELTWIGNYIHGKKAFCSHLHCAWVFDVHWDVGLLRSLNQCPLSSARTVCVLVTCLCSGAFTTYFYLYSKVQLLVLVRIISVIYSRQNLSHISKLQTKGKQGFPSARPSPHLDLFFPWNMLPHNFICSYSLPSSSDTSLGPHCSRLKRSHMKTSHKTLNTSAWTYQCTTRAVFLSLTWGSELAAGGQGCTAPFFGLCFTSATTSSAAAFSCCLVASSWLRSRNPKPHVQTLKFHLCFILDTLRAQSDFLCLWSPSTAEGKNVFKHRVLLNTILSAWAILCEKNHN